MDPQTLPQHFDSREAETRWDARWRELGVYRFREDAGERFVIDTPPPTEAGAVAVPMDMVSQIAQRVVAQISEKVIREIAWEVIPDMAEALIKREIERLTAELQRG